MIKTMTIEEYRKLERKEKKKKSKYNNNPVWVDGIRFASNAEGRRYSELKLLERAGEIHDLSLQVSFVLFEKQKCEEIDDLGVHKYIADFTYRDKNDKFIIEDVKGYRDTKSVVYRHFLLKKAAMKYFYGYEVREITR